MKTKTPNFPNRKSIRLCGFDYASPSSYFITICVKDFKCLFGHIKNEKMHFNAAGKTIEKWWLKIPSKFKHIQLEAYQIMPNHLHGIITISQGNLEKDKPTTIGQMVQWFKIMSTNEYIRGVKNHNWAPFNKRLWHRDYYEHIIRNKDAHQKITTYINNNPKTWQLDKFTQ